MLSLLSFFRRPSPETKHVHHQSLAWKASVLLSWAGHRWSETRVVCDGLCTCSHRHLLHRFLATVSYGVIGSIYYLSWQGDDGWTDRFTHTSTSQRLRTTAGFHFLKVGPVCDIWNNRECVFTPLSSFIHDPNRFIPARRVDNVFVL